RRERDLGLTAELARLEVRNQLGHELLRLAAAGAVADRHDRKLILADDLFEAQPRLGLAERFVLAVDRVRVDDLVLDHGALLVERGELATGAQAGVDRQDALAAQWRL